MTVQTPSSRTLIPPHYTTLEVAKLLGMAVRSIQLMVDRGELQAWKTAGGHRRISRASVDAWLRERAADDVQTASALEIVSQAPVSSPHHATQGHRPRILLIEDSVHFQNLVRLLVEHQFPQMELHVANDGISGLMLYGQLRPDVLIIDILLPGIDGATLITALRTRPEFADIALIVITSLSTEERAPYAFALNDVKVIYKPQLVNELPIALSSVGKQEAS